MFLLLFAMPCWAVDVTAGARRNAGMPQVVDGVGASIRVPTAVPVAVRFQGDFTWVKPDLSLVAAVQDLADESGTDASLTIGVVRGSAAVMLDTDFGVQGGPTDRPWVSPHFQSGLWGGMQHRVALEHGQSTVSHPAVFGPLIGMAATAHLGPVGLALGTQVRIPLLVPTLPIQTISTLDLVLSL